jgi:hypothetical protein
MYLNILNILLAIILVILMVYLGYNLYLNSKEVVRYEPPKFQEFESDSSKSIDNIPVYNSKIILKTVENHSGLVSFKIKTIDSTKSFQIDWGNGLKVPYLGSSFSQKLPPMFYNPGSYTIEILCESNTFESIEYLSSSPDLKSINIKNMMFPKGLKSTGNLPFA